MYEHLQQHLRHKGWPEEDIAHAIQLLIQGEEKKSRTYFQ